MQAPAWQVSVCVQALPSVQAVPSGLAGVEQVPVAGSQVPASWHCSRAAQTTGLVPLQAPAWQVSVCVHALLSVQAVPSGFSGLEHTPVDGSQVPASWHCPSAVQTTGFAPTQAPAWQVSLCVQALPSLQVAPSGL